MATHIEYDLESCDSDGDFSESDIILECEVEDFSCQSVSECTSDEEFDHETIHPYMYEPEDSDSEEGENTNGGLVDETPEVQLRTRTLDWCNCDQCQIMPSAAECRCCKEMASVEKRIQEGEEMYGKPIKCITQHPGFEAACLNIHVLDIAWFQYRQQYGAGHDRAPGHKKRRHVAYRQLARWCWGFLGKNLRVTLPACAVSCIRAHFPPPGDEDDFDFVGFQA